MKGRLLIATFPLLVLPTACSATAVDGGAAVDEAPPFQPVTAVYECGEGEEAFRLVTRTRPGGLHVFLPPQLGEPYRNLAAAPGGRYAGEDVEVLPGQGAATLRLGREEAYRCRYDHGASIWEHAKLNGVDFRAVGNEPGWVLEIREQDRLDLNYDYGAASLSLPIVETRPEPERRRTVYVGRKGAQTLRVVLTGEVCNDTMSDEVYAVRVVVAFDDRRLSGCGRALH